MTIESAANALSLPLVLRAAVPEVDLSSWAEANRSLIDSKLAEHGALLFRGFDGVDLSGFERFIRAVSGDLQEYRERSSPRTRVRGNIYTSTEYPRDQAIFLHNENSYAHTWPRKVFFMCTTPPERGGATPIADCRAVYQAITAEVRDRLVERGVLYVRNFSEEVGLPWQTVFDTSDREVVMSRFRDAGYRVEWTGENRLRAKRVGPAAIRHPQTHAWTWFNHATFFHVSTLEPTLQDALRAQFSEEDLPNNTYYGDGSPIEPDVLDDLRAAYAQAKVSVPWELSDVLMVDNMLTAHGREPFEGSRQIRVGMSEPFTSNDIRVE